MNFFGPALPWLLILYIPQYFYIEPKKRPILTVKVPTTKCKDPQSLALQTSLTHRPRHTPVGPITNYIIHSTPQTPHHSPHRPFPGSFSSLAPNNSFHRLTHHEPDKTLIPQGSPFTPQIPHHNSLSHTIIPQALISHNIIPHHSPYRPAQQCLQDPWYSNSPRHLTAPHPSPTDPWALTLKTNYSPLQTYPLFAP